MSKTPRNQQATGPRADTFFKRGWIRFPHDPKIAAWVDAALPHARTCVSAPENTEWLRYGGTWFAGVNVLGNDGAGRVGPGTPELNGAAVDFISGILGLKACEHFVWDKGQVSVCYPGYPRPMASETEGAYRYRLKRDAAHLDGLHPVGPGRRRHIREAHAFVLGLPLAETSADASPLVVWEGSHEMIRKALAEALDGVAPENWGNVDLTDAYHAVRREIFESCDRTIVHALPGEAYLIHRLALHGVAPWGANASAGPDGRMIVYFRPEISAPGSDAVRDWLDAP